MLQAKNTVGFHFDCWVELWGNHVKFPVESSDKNLEKIKEFSDYKYDFIFHENSSYADDNGDKFFYDWQLRIASPYGAGNAFLEEMTMDLAIHDALHFTSGGLYLDKAHADIQLEFAKEFRKLPAVKFNEIKCFGSVTARYYYDGERTFIYAVNREPYENLVEIKLGEESLLESIAPYMLKVWILNGEKIPKTATSKLPAFVKEKYSEKVDKALSLLNTIDKTLAWAKGVDLIKERLVSAMQLEKFHEVRHLLCSYIVKKAEAIGK